MADIGASNWNEADASNSTAAPDGWPEGMAPSGVNDSGRAMMGAVKRWYDWSVPLVTGGTSTAYTLSYSVAPGALVDGMTHVVQFNAANGAAATLNVNALGAKPLHYYSAGAWRVAPTGLVNTNQTFPVVYNASAGAYRIQRSRDDTGEVVPFAGSTAPAGSLLCFGQAVSRTDYVGLFTALSTTYGTGDGSTTFNLPDLRGRVAAGKDNMGGSAASRLTSTIMSPDGNTLAATGGAQTETTTIAGTAHTNGMFTTVGSDANVRMEGTGAFNANSTTHVHLISGDASVDGATGTATNVQPSIILNYVIRI